MFPTISHLLNYLFHVHLNLPFQTFGFFEAIAFLVTYFVFISEFKRYEASGNIHPFKRVVSNSKFSFILELTVNFLLGFLFGFKIFGILLNRDSFTLNPIGFLGSMQGSLPAGLLAGAAIGYWVWTDHRKQLKNQPEVTVHFIHPYQSFGPMVFWMSCWGFTGAKLFDCAEHLNDLWYDPLKTLLSSGFTYYGGLIFGALTYLYLGHKRGMKLIDLADIGSPGMMLAYGVGRIGCQLAGDGDWGVINNHPMPGWLHFLPHWMWSFNFPHNVLNRGVSIPGCAGNYCNVLPVGVFPTSFYEAAGCIFLFLLMWIFRKRIRIPGLMFFIFLLLNGMERFFIEFIRVNTRYQFLGFNFTQAQWICVLLIGGGIGGIVSLCRPGAKRHVPQIDA